MNDGRIFIDDPAQLFKGGGFAQRQIERMHVSAGMVKNTPNIGIRIHMPAQLLFIEHYLIFDTVSGPEVQPVFQFAHMRARIGGNDIAVFQIALDVIGFNALTDNVSAFLHQSGNETRRVRAIALTDSFQAGVQAVDDLSAVSPRSAPPHLRAFDNGDLGTAATVGWLLTMIVLAVNLVQLKLASYVGREK